MPLGPQELLTAAPHLVADALRRFGRAQLRPLGGSMFPSIQSGDIVTVHACGIEHLMRGDVVLVLDGDRLIVHRLVARTASDVVLRGDAHWRNDQARPHRAILGRIVTIARGGVTRPAPFPCSFVDRVRGLVMSEWTRLSRSAKAFALQAAALKRRATRRTLARPAPAP